MTIGEEVIISALQEEDAQILFRVKPERLDAKSERELLDFAIDYLKDYDELPNLKRSIPQ